MERIQQEKKKLEEETVKREAKEKQALEVEKMRQQKIEKEKRDYLIRSKTSITNNARDRPNISLAKEDIVIDMD